jgi:hypothetical protein
VPTPRLTLLTTSRSVPGSAWQALSGTVRRWALDSQRQACRNAMVAGTALAARRAEREEVEEFLAARLPRPRTGEHDAEVAHDGDHSAHG